MDIYIFDNDQPTTCPKCGARTDFKEIIRKNQEIQIHICLNPECQYKFIGEFEEENLRQG